MADFGVAVWREGLGIGASELVYRATVAVLTFSYELKRNNGVAMWLTKLPERSP
jgi:hypothetical protein